MCKNCQSTYAASFSPASMAITNPELIWSQVQEQKRISASKTPSSPPSRSAAKPPAPSDAASTFSESTTLSYDKDDMKAASKPRKSMRQRIKDVWGDKASQPTVRDGRKHDADAGAGAEANTEAADP